MDDISWLLRQDLWKLREAVCLLHEIAPTVENRKSLSTDKKSEAYITYESAKRSINAEILPHKKKNKVLYITPEDFVSWAMSRAYNVPSELLDCVANIVEMNRQIISKTSVNSSTIDKLVCQGIARTLWDLDPNLTIEALTKHKAIQTYGGGSNYTGKHTLRKWLSEADPRPEKEKTGRPAKK